MNMPFPSREQVEFIRKNYPPGTRVILLVKEHGQIALYLPGSKYPVMECRQNGDQNSSCQIPAEYRVPTA